MNIKIQASVSFVDNFSVDLLQRPIAPEMVMFYITQDTQRHPLLPELKSGVLIFHLAVKIF